MVQPLQSAATSEKSVSAPEQLNLYSLGDLEHLLGFSREAMREVVRIATSFYTPFHQFKKILPFARKKQKRTARLIDRPTGLLRRIQDRIYRKLLRDLAMPSYICGGVKGRSVLMNVSFHSGANVI